MLALERLQDAHWLSLVAVPASPNATALVAELAAIVATSEVTSGGRRTKRRKAGQAKLHGAIGAVVGGLLRRWSRSIPGATFRPRTASAFSGGLVGARQFAATVDGLKRCGLIHEAKAIRYLTFDWGDGQTVFDGKAGRFWPTAELLARAAHHGVVPATLAADFGDIIPSKAPSVPAPLVVKALKQPGQRDRRRLPVSKLGADLERLRSAVEEANSFAAAQTVEGCLAPRWYRVFTECSLLDGRWQAAGTDAIYQLMPEADRVARIRINGEPVAEVDVSGSQLSIMHGLLGLPLPHGDLYDFPNAPRAVIKAWILATMGKGSPVVQWSPKAVKAYRELGDYDPKEVGRVICHRYPFLRKPAESVCSEAGLDKLTHIAKPTKLLTHRLMNIEAAAIGGAIQYLRTARGVLALPIHDSLIVPRSAVGYVGGALEGVMHIGSAPRRA